MTQLDEIEVMLPECCICGDFGLSGELYRCTVCLFRSQHRYCSNQYPKARVYRVCNWCLITPQEESRNSMKIKMAKNSSDLISSRDDETVESDRDNGYSKRSRKISISWEPRLQLRSRSAGNRRVKKADESPEVLPPRKRIITMGALEEKHRRMKSEEMAKRGIIRPRQVFRSRVRRYKLLEEVSC